MGADQLDRNCGTGGSRITCGCCAHCAALRWQRRRELRHRWHNSREVQRGFAERKRAGEHRLQDECDRVRVDECRLSKEPGNHAETRGECSQLNDRCVKCERALPDWEAPFFLCSIVELLGQCYCAFHLELPSRTRGAG